MKDTPQSAIRNPKSKLRVGVLFGGRSAEHEVSLVSAQSVIDALDKDKYDIICIGITPEGRWLSSPEAVRLLKSKKPLDHFPEKILLPDPQKKGLVELNPQSPPDRRAGTIRNSKSLDVIFPVLHGTFGEDGTVQGLLDLANIPYVGAGVLGSAVGMDKVVAKELCEHEGIPLTPYVWFLAKQYAAEGKRIVSLIEKKLRYPCFVKPANMGSSIGISKAHNKKELLDAVESASEYDRKILVEKSIEDAREIEVSVLGNDDPVASVPGEILSSNEFYDYDAKYVDGKSQSIIPAQLPGIVVKKLRDYATRSFLVTDCAGMARVDFLVQRKSHRIYFNEINTIPGFTSISMFPKLWEASGIPYPKLLDRLIELAMERHEEKSSLKTSYKSASDWYKE